jgi:hypothetical protein
MLPLGEVGQLASTSLAMPARAAAHKILLLFHVFYVFYCCYDATRRAAAFAGCPAYLHDKA